MFDLTASIIFSLRFKSSFISKDGVPNIKLFIKKGKNNKIKKKNNIFFIIFFKFIFFFLILKNL